MKKTALLTLQLGLLCNILSAQDTTDFIDVNNIKAAIQANGFLFNQPDTNDFGHARKASFEVPKGTGVNAFYAASLIVAGKEGSIVKSAVNIYSTENDYKAGPVGDQYNAAYDLKYDRLWKVDRQMIEQHYKRYADPNYVMPEVIQNWPANGDVSNGEAANLAPFIDLNSNSIYEPEQGEYPCIKGDQAVYSIFNDTRIDFSGGAIESMELEVHLMLYAYNTEDEVNNTVFTNYKIFNRSSSMYSDVYLGLHADGDLGCADDDKVGCDTNLNSFFFYNGDRIDEDCRGALGYQAMPPACGILFPGAKMSSFHYYSRSAGPVGDPRSSVDFYNYLRSYWRDGTHVTYDSTGYMGTINTNYMFPGDPSDTNQWSDVYRPFDRRGIGSTGPYDLAAGASVELDVAFVYARSATDTSIYGGLNALKSAIPVVQQFYNAQQSACYLATGVEEQQANLQVQLYPNPVKDVLQIRYPEMLPTNIRIVDVVGKVVVASQRPVTQLDVSLLDEGIYFVVADWENKSAVERIVVVH